MDINVKGLGIVNYNNEELIHFDMGLYGFDQLHKYLPMPLEDDSDRMIILQSVEDEMISFVLINPFIYIKDYNPHPNTEELSILGNPNDEDISYYVICSLKQTLEDSTMNLKCPIAVNAKSRQAVQLVLDNDKYKFRHRFGDFKELCKSLAPDNKGGAKC